MATHDFWNVGQTMRAIQATDLVFPTPTLFHVPHNSAQNSPPVEGSLSTNKTCSSNLLPGRKPCCSSGCLDFHHTAKDEICKYLVEKPPARNGSQINDMPVLADPEETSRLPSWNHSGIVSLDLSKAFNHVHWPMLWVALREQGFLSTAFPC